MKHREKGFVILVAIGVLMGLLAIVSATVVFSQQNESQKYVAPQDSSVDMIVRSAKNMLYRKNRLNSPNDKTKLMRNWFVPSLRDIPIRLCLSEDYNPSSTEIHVYDMRKLFFNLATSKVFISNVPVLMRLDRDLSEDETQFMVEAKGTSTTTLQDFYPGDFISVGNELMAIKSVDGSGLIEVEDRNAHGYGGIRSNHKEGEPVFAVSTNDLSGFLKLESSWFRVEVGRMSHDDSGSTTPFFNIIDYDGDPTNASLRGEPHYRTVEFDRNNDGRPYRTVEFYPFDPGFAQMGNDWDLSFSLKVEDENGKLNLNTLTKNMVSSYFSSSKYEDTMKDVNEYFFPMKNVNEILYTADGTHGSTLNSYNLYQKDFTVYSKPNFLTNYENTDTDAEFYSKSNRHSHFHFNGLDDKHDLKHVLRKNTNVYEYTDNASDDDLVLPHQINLNTASYDLMVKLFDTIGYGYKKEVIDTDDPGYPSSGNTKIVTNNENGSLKASKLAYAIMQYRAGEEVDAVDDEISATQLNYHDFINPFDGLNDDADFDGIRDDGSAVHYVSAEREFAAFLDEMKSLNVINHRQKDFIMSYIYQDVEAIEHYLNYYSLPGTPSGPATDDTPNSHGESINQFANFLTFEASEVTTQEMKVNISYQGEPVVAFDERVVSENYPTHSAQGYKIGETSGPESNGEVILNNLYGWNHDQSIFYGVTVEQPQIEYYDSTNNTVTIDHTVTRHNGRVIRHNKPHIYSSLAANVNTGLVYINSYREEPTDVGTSVAKFDITGTPDASHDQYWDFGMRIKGAGNVKTLHDGNAGLTSPGNLTARSFDITNAALLTSFNADILNEWPVTAGLVLTINDTNHFRIVGLNGAGSNIIIEPEPDPALQIALPGSTNILISSTVDPRFYQFPDGAGGQAVGSVLGDEGAFYETVIYRPGAIFERIEWTDSSSMAGIGTSMKVKVLSLDGETVLQTENTNNYLNLSPAIDGGRIRIRFLFHDAIDAGDVVGRLFPTPQLFEVKVKYYLDDGVVPERFVYSKG